MHDSQLAVKQGSPGLQREKRNQRQSQEFLRLRRDKTFKSVQIPISDMGQLWHGMKTVCSLQNSPVPLEQGPGIEGLHAQNSECSLNLNRKKLTFILLNFQLKCSIFFSYERSQQTTGGPAFPMVLPPIEIIGIFLSRYCFPLTAIMTCTDLVTRCVWGEFITISWNIFKTYFGNCFSKQELFLG